jgi:hypothetical protein
VYFSPFQIVICTCWWSSGCKSLRGPRHHLNAKEQANQGRQTAYIRSATPDPEVTRIARPKMAAKTSDLPRLLTARDLPRLHPRRPACPTKSLSCQSSRLHRASWQPSQQTLWNRPHSPSHTHANQPITPWDSLSEQRKIYFSTP